MRNIIERIVATALDESKVNRAYTPSKIDDISKMTVRLGLILMHKVMELSLDLILVTDLKNIILQVSNSSKSILEYEPKELIGGNFFDFLYKDDLLQTNHTRDSLVSKSLYVENFRNRWVTKSGKVVSLEWCSRYDKSESIVVGIARKVGEN